ncbi:MAG: hypothetical protein FWG94_12550 [Oscillospiraceae bacterium]|nr:hypothetical protein [Oscillospiraceae bacterium]
MMIGENRTQVNQTAQAGQEAHIQNDAEIQRLRDSQGDEKGLMFHPDTRSKHDDLELSPHYQNLKRTENFMNEDMQKAVEEQGKVDDTEKVNAKTKEDDTEKTNADEAYRAVTDGSKILAEIAKLKQSKQQIQQQLSNVQGDENRRRELEAQLTALDSELRIKDNADYIFNNADVIVTRIS